jgi:hypothetical protein
VYTNTGKAWDKNLSGVELWSGVMEWSCGVELWIMVKVAITVLNSRENLE